MKHLFAALMLLIVSTTSSYALEPVPVDPPTAEGYWLTENKRAVIHIEECVKGLCGSVFWIIEGGLQTDKFNEDESLRSRPICGLEILYGFRQDLDDPLEWDDGYIYKADDGDLYDANIEVIDHKTLELRGYVGISWFGSTQRWTRVSHTDYAICKKPHELIED